MGGGQNRAPRPENDHVSYPGYVEVFPEDEDAVRRAYRTLEDISVGASDDGWNAGFLRSSSRLR